MRTITVGDFGVTALTDIEGPFFGLDQIFPGVKADAWAPYVARYPWAFADGRTLYGRVGAYLLRSPGKTVLVDTGVGPGAFGRPGRLMEDLGSGGVETSDVDVVFLTHLHGDHVGWSVRADGEPVFENARYVTQAQEWEASAPYLGRSMAALDGAGVLDLLDGEEPVARGFDELTAIPTPGHSPGHASLLVSSGGEQALIAGDAIVNPAQVTEPTWNIHFDADKEQSARTREMLLGWLEADGMTVAAGHIPGSGFGRVVREGASPGRRYWQPIHPQAPQDEPLGARSAGGDRP